MVDNLGNYGLSVHRGLEVSSLSGKVDLLSTVTFTSSIAVIATSKQRSGGVVGL